MKPEPIELAEQITERELDVPRLRQDMLDLWRREGETLHRGRTVTRACLSTLVVPAVPGDRAEAFLQELVPLFPSRVLLVRTDPARPRASVRAWVTGWCSRKAEGNSLVCSEVVHMTAGPGSGPRVASAVRSLAVGGLPVRVLSPTVTPLEVDWVPPLEDFVDLVVGDSTVLAPEKVLALWRRSLSTGRTGFADVLWASLVDWRRALAVWFDRPGEAETAAEITRVEIEVADTGGGVQKAWLLAGWLGSRLGWQLAQTGEDRFLMKGPKGVVEVLIRCVPADDDPALTLSVTLGFQHPERALCWRRVSPERAIVVERGRDGKRLFRLNQTKTDPASAVVQLFRRHQRDSVADAAMSLAVELGGNRRTS